MPLITKIETSNKSMYTNNIKSIYIKDSNYSSSKDKNKNKTRNKYNNKNNNDLYTNTLSYIKNITS